MTEWETAIAEAKALNVADTEEAEYWAKDLALGLQPVMPVWAANFTSNNDEKIYGGTAVKYSMWVK